MYFTYKNISIDKASFLNNFSKKDFILFVGVRTHDKTTHYKVLQHYNIKLFYQQNNF